jgi:hypothetical protein
MVAPHLESCMLWYRLKSETTYPVTGVVSALADGLLGEIPPEGGQDVIQGKPDNSGAQPHAGDRTISGESKYGFFVKSCHLRNGADIH